MLVVDTTDIALLRLVDPDPIVRKLGAQSLATQRSISKLKIAQHALVLENDPGVVKWLALALGNLRDPSSIPFLEQKRRTMQSEDALNWIDVALSKMRPSSKKRLRNLFSSSSAESIRQAAAECWQNSEMDETLARPLLKAIEHTDGSVRRWAALSISTTSFLTDASPLLDGLNDSEYLVREWTECALSRMRDQRAYAPLLFRLSDSEPRVREWAIKALAQYEEPELAEVLIARYKPETDIQCKEAIVHALKKAASLGNVKQFLWSIVANDQLSPVVLLAIIDVVATASNLSADTDFTRSLVTRCRQMNSNLLSQELAAGLIRTLSPGEAEAVREVTSSKRSRLVVETILDLETGRDRHKFTSVPMGEALRVTGLRSETTENREYDIGFVIALREEFENVEDLIEDRESHPSPETGEIYYTFTLPSSCLGLPFTCIATVSNMGTGRAALSADRLLRRAQPLALVNFGIAASLHDDVRLCDVVVANQVDNYIECAKAIPEQQAGGYTLELAGDPFKCDHLLTTRVADLEPAFRSDFAALMETVGQEYQLSSKHLEPLFVDGLMRRKLRVTEGHVASASIVGQAEAFGSWLLGRRDRSFKALEMEGAGIALAAHSQKRHYRTLLVRGISDFGNERKKALDTIDKGLVRRLAVRNAFRVVVAALGTLSREELAE